VRDLSSDILGTGNTLQKFNEATETQVVDLDVKGLPSHAQSEDIKKISGVKHVISAVVEHDALTNACTGTGRIKMRLTGNEDLDNVKLQFLKAGYGVQEHAENTNKKSGFSSGNESLSQDSRSS